MLNQNFHEKVVLQSDELSSVLSPCNGVIRTPLERNEDSEYAISTAFPQTTIRAGFTMRYNFGN